MRKATGLSLALLGWLAIGSVANDPVAEAAEASPAGETGQADERVRLDDFAVPRSRERRSPDVDQVAPPIRSRKRVAPLSAPPAPQSGLVEQLEGGQGAGQGTGPEQVTSPGSGTRQPIPAIASTSDSKPGSAQRIAGEDECDPRSGSARQSERCKHILEHRAAEFNAPEAPVLTAEEELLIAQQPVDPSLDKAVQGLSRLDPSDADSRSNQELAAIVLEQQQPVLDVSSSPAPDSQAPISLDQALIDTLGQYAAGSGN